MKIIRLLKTADLFTMANFVSGLLSIFSSIRGNFIYAVGYIFLAAIFDFLDGKVARLLKQQNELGKQLDSLSDLTSFGIAPAVAAYMFGLRSSTIGTVACVCFALAAMLRLARFNVSKIKHFEGLPTTAAAFIFSSMLIVFSTALEGFFMTKLILIAYLFIGAYLMVSSIKIKKF